MLLHRVYGPRGTIINFTRNATILVFTDDAAETKASTSHPAHVIDYCGAGRRSKNRRKFTGERPRKMIDVDVFWMSIKTLETRGAFFAEEFICACRLIFAMLYDLLCTIRIILQKF